ncbi:hypothetical protein I4U23_002119 [Adineta vaga]|nr:hypothetical protein I4U23_002119 [Adineta vaga]
MFTWRILLGLLIFLCSSIGLLSSMIFISIVIIHRSLRQNLSLLLAINLNIGGSIICISMINQSIHMLKNSPEDALCSYRSYFMTVGGLYIFQTTLLQSLHRLCSTVFVQYRHNQNRYLFLFLSLFSFSLCSIGLLPLLFGKRFPYYPDAHACYIALNDLFGVLYPSICFYFIPLLLQTIISLWILRYISHMTVVGRSPYKTKRRILKERRVLFRLSIPVLLLMSVGLIYFVFFFRTIMSGKQWQAPAYALHLSFFGTSFATALSMLTNFIFYHQVNKILQSTFRYLFRCHAQNKSTHHRIIVLK